MTDVRGMDLIEEDDFAGTNGNPPDDTKWQVWVYSPEESVTIDGNRVRVIGAHSNWPAAVSKDPFETNNFTILVDFMGGAVHRAPLFLESRVNVSGYYRWGAGISYNNQYGWFLYSYPNGYLQYVKSNLHTYQSGVWYTVNLTVLEDKMNATIREKDTGNLVWSKNDVTTRLHKGDNLVHLGVHDDTAYYDNFKLYDLTPPPNIPPSWDQLPLIQAVEDVPLVYDFSSYVRDVDGPRQALSLSSASQFVTKIDDLNVTFLFPNNVISAKVPMVLSDRWDSAVIDVNFSILPVNDPPYHDISRNHIADEDVPFFMDFSDNVWDVDNDLEELFIILDDPYIETGRLNLTASFPEGVHNHRLVLEISDGNDTTQVTLQFTVRPYDDPPSLSLPEVFHVIEDRVSVFNITPYINDTDTPIEEIIVAVDNENCTVWQRELHFLFTNGGFMLNVGLTISDGRSIVGGYLLVIVEEVNDAPIVHPISLRKLLEDESTTVDLTAYIEDEDTPIEELSLACDHPSLTLVNGLELTFLYLTWEPRHRVDFTVSDGLLATDGHFDVQISAVNDNPSIVGIGEILSPFIIHIDEGTEAWFDIVVIDEEDSEFSYSLSSDWTGVSAVSNGSLKVRAVAEDIGTHMATLTVDDRYGGTDSCEITIIVENVNDAPSKPTILKPLNGTSFDEGEYITFAVDIHDPDMSQVGQALTVSWASNLTGVFKEVSTDNELEFIENDLSVGSHRITVSVSDGEYTRSAWFELTINEEYIPPNDDDDGGSFFTQAPGIALIIVILLVIVGTIIFVVRNRREMTQDDERTADHRGDGPITVDMEGQILPESSGGALENHDAVNGTTPQEAPSSQHGGSERELDESTPLPAIAVKMEYSADELEERAHTTEVREVMETLTQLPQGLPNKLWGWDLTDLARSIVDGEKSSTPDGTEIVKIGNWWFTSDYRQIGTFLREWSHDDRTSLDLDEDERERKLKQLEDMLMEGDITEETYERLRSKYEGP